MHTPAWQARTALVADARLMGSSRHLPFLSDRLSSCLAAGVFSD